MLAGAVKGGEKVGHRGGGIVYHRHDEKELNWELRGVRSGGSPAHAGIDRRCVIPSASFLRFPRPRGDRPRQWLARGLRTKVPPPTRG